MSLEKERELRGRQALVSQGPHGSMALSKQAMSLGRRRRMLSRYGHVATDER